MATKKVAAKKTVAKKVTVKKTVAKKTTKCTSKCAPKKVAVETKVKEQNVNSNSYIVIDYPVEKETIFGDVYVIRIGASFDGFVEISFNDGEWQPCRFASGYWWFDWMYYKSGNYKIVARLIGKDGNVIKVSDVKSCKVS